MQKSIGFCLILLGWIGFSSCGKESVTLEDGTLESYVNLQPGKYIIYQLDSLVKVPFNDTAFTTRSYQAKDLVDTLITDNLGRPSWRVFRYLRPLGSNDESAWEPSDTYYITPTRSDLEVVENNLRFQKLVYPIKESIYWFGNKHINTTPGGPLDFLDTWEYNYTEIGGSFAPFDVPVDSTITILQTDQGSGFADDYNPLDPDQPGYRIYSIEVYAKNIGLIYKHLLHFNYKARTLNGSNNPVPPYPDGNKDGGAITLRMISHN
ncbi:hypothetical protein [Flavihumibacter fluvii]|uniref:hypothetical protein n=1 Tax=Flavihumibacter fluvii TaxID=2838157 RepID=UPI001BDE8CF9|nr:hypothetical protein [Flavihumibacter fluvii]ULQ54823.1 hypothetical protein KJS93_10905 [Flavihumibacter fluvii]